MQCSMDKQYIFHLCDIEYLYDIVSLVLVFIPSECDDLRQTNTNVSHSIVYQLRAIHIMRHKLQ